MRDRRETFPQQGKFIHLISRERLPLWITLVYLVLGSTWILISDTLLPTLVLNPEDQQRVQTGKGLAYVLLTGLFLWISLRLYARVMGRQRQELKTSREQYKSLFHSIQDPILVTNTRREITDCNPAFEKLFGYSLSEILGKKTRIIYHHQDQYRSLGHKISSASDPVNLNLTTIYRRKDGETFPGQTSISFLHNPEGVLTGYIGIIQDVSTYYETQAALQDSEDELRTLVEQAPLGIFQTTSDGHVLEINTRMARILGYDSPAAALEDYQQLSRDLYVDSARREEFLDQLKSEGFVEDFRFQAFEKDGKKIWLSMNARISQRSPDGGFTIQGFCSDITDQLLSERALQESESRYRQHLEISFDGIVIYQNERIKFINQKGAELLGAEDADQLVGQPVLDFIPDGRRRSIQEAIQALTEQGKSIILEEQFRRLNGKLIDMEFSTIPITYQGEEAGQVVFRDITQRKWTEQALLEERDRAQKYLDIAGVMIVALDKEGRITLINDSGVDLLGYQRDQELIGKNWFETCLPDEIRGKVEESFHNILDSETPLSRHQNRVVTAGGKERIMDWHNVILRNEKGRVVGTLSSGNDITDRVRAEQELKDYQEHLEEIVAQRTRELEDRVEEVETLNKALTNLLQDLQVTNQKLERTTRQLQDANQELESFTYSVSHDLRAPLRAIEGFSQILTEEFDPDLPPEAHRYLNLLLENVRRMKRLIHDLLALSRLGNKSLRREEIETQNLVENIIREQTQGKANRDLDITIQDLPPCQADPGLIEQVFSNLIDNALKYTKNQAQAKIEIGSQREDEELIFHVQDNGVGFDMDYQEKLFAVFQRLHKEENYAGSGVGLAIVQRIVHRHGGRVWAESTPDQGSTFYFSLPTPQRPARGRVDKQGDHV